MACLWSQTAYLTEQQVQTQIDQSGKEFFCTLWISLPSAATLYIYSCIKYRKLVTVSRAANTDSISAVYSSCSEKL